MTDDEQLLQRYARERSESAFSELVARHIDLVYAAALRVVNGDSHLAQDVTQTVFIDLARKAQSLPRGVVLAGWLHQHTCYKASTAVRTEQRRKTREQTAMEMKTLDDNTSPSWEAIAPYLDEGLSQLDPSDRDALVLRFLKRQDFRAVGESLGISEDAAQKRVSRAVERLREIFAKCGLTVGASGLAVLISGNAVQAAPAGLALTISAAATLPGTALGVSTAIPATKTIAMTALQKTIIGAALTTAIGTGLYEARQVSRLRAEILTLPSNQQAERLVREGADRARQVAALRDENSRWNSNPSELLMLRGEAARLRNESQESARVRVANANKTDAAMEAAMKSWLGRVKELRRRSEQAPGASIPELKYLADRDWVDAAGDTLKTEEAYRKALAVLRAEATTRFLARAVRPALEKYSQANGGQFPSDLSRLQPYFESTEDYAMLQRYQAIPAIYLSNDASRIGEWAITGKDPVDDQIDLRVSIGANGDVLKSARTQMDGALDSAIAAFAAANSGHLPTGIYDLQPFLGSGEKESFEQRVKFNRNKLPPTSAPTSPVMRP